MPQTEEEETAVSAETAGWSVYFDLDDTLIFTQYKYNLAAMGCATTLLREFGLHAPHPKTVLDHFAAVDLRNTEKHGFRRSRFAASWQETYDHFSASLGVATREHTREELEAIVATVTNPPFLVKPEVEFVLAQVRPLAAEMFILTMGEDRVQRNKAASLPVGVQQAFDDVLVVHRKDEKGFRKILDGRDPSRCIMVGNSMRSDVIPAISGGAWAVYLPFETWAYEQLEPVTSERLFTIQSFRQVPRVVKGILG